MIKRLLGYGHNTYRELYDKYQTRGSLNPNQQKKKIVIYEHRENKNVIKILEIFFLCR